MRDNTQKVLRTLERFKVHHIVFWALYHFGWWTIFTGSATQVLDSLSEPHTIVKYLGYVIYQAVGVYFCLYFLIPRYLKKGAYLKFFVATIAVVVFMAAAITTNYFIAGEVAGASPYDLFKITERSPLAIFKYNALPSCVGAITLGMSIKLTKIWVDSQKRQQLLEKEKLETELKFLKSQFNPHFLFNTINSIFVLINKNPEMASESLVKFSNLLRYQLYECNTPQIPLKNELAYVQSFMELESLRQNHNFELVVEIEEDFDKEYLIAPFILVPFVENAFKHLSEDRKLRKWVKLKLSVEEGELNFKLSNSADFNVHQELPNTESFGGLGLKNVKRRLSLIYPNAHHLLIDKGKDTFGVQLKLELREESIRLLKKVSV